MTAADADRRLLVAGAGGHAKVVIDAARAAGWLPAGVLARSPAPASVLGVPVLGADDDAARFFAEGLAHAFVAIGDNRVRLKLGRALQAIGFTCPAVIHPSAIISATARIGDGVLVMPGAIINADAVVGDFAIVNTAAVVEHDCRLGDGAHVAPQSAIGGNVTIGAGTLFGIGSTARPGITIGAHAVVGAGSVVVADVPDGAVYAGVPARLLQREGQS